MDREDAFLLWLVEDKRMRKDSASDVISRCRRVEKLMDISLDEYVSSGKIEQVVRYLQNNSKVYLKPGANKYATTVIIRAVHLYDEFLNSKHS